MTAATAAVAFLPVAEATPVLGDATRPTEVVAGDRAAEEEALATYFGAQVKALGEQWRAAGTATILSVNAESDATAGAVRIHVVAQDQSGQFAGDATYTDMGGVLALANLSTAAFVSHLYLPNSATGAPEYAGVAPEGYVDVQFLPADDTSGVSPQALAPGCLLYVYRPYISTASGSLITGGTVADCNQPVSISVQTWGQKRTSGGWVQVSYYADSDSSAYALYSYSAYRCNGTATRTYRTRVTGLTGGGSGKTGYSSGVELKCS